MKKTRKLLLLLALVCTLLVCCVMSASAAKQIEWKGGTYYTDDDEKYVFYDDSYLQIIGVTDNFTNTGLEFCGFCTVDGEIVYPIGYGINNNDSYNGAIYPLKTFSQFTITASPKVTGESVLDGQIIFVSAFSWMTVEGKFKIPYNVTAIAESAFAFTRVGSFDVADNNKYFHDDENGILYGRYYNFKGEFTGNDFVIMAPDKTVDHIDIPDNVTDIYSYAYYYYKAKTINIPTSVTRIGGAAFPCLALGSTDKFDAVYYEGTIDQWNKITIEDSNGRITKAHLFCNDWYKISDQTCTTAEIERRDCHCSDSCDKYETREVKPALGHNYCDLIAIVEADCVTKRVETYKCSRCTSTDTKYLEIDSSNHAGPIEERNYVAPTCGVDGKEADTYCVACDATLSIGAVIPATGNHDNVVTTIDEATCVLEGLESYDCKNCDYYVEKVVAINAKNHQGETYIKGDYPETCGEWGHTGDTYCNDCQKLISYGTSIRPTGNHIYGDWVIVKDPTCSVYGQKEQTCIVCGDVHSGIIATLPHTYPDDWTLRIAPTCVYSGQEYKKCLNCTNTIYQTLAPVPHNEPDVLLEEYSYIEKQATCITPGIKVYQCQNLGYGCEAKKVVEIEAQGHKYSDYWTTVKESTCCVNGTAVRKCYWFDECGEQMTRSLMLVTHLKADEPYYEVPSTCRDAGRKVYKCIRDENCNYEFVVYNSQLDPNRHALYHIVNSVEPTCCEEGYVGDYECSDCKVIFRKGETIPATGEHPGIGERVKREAYCTRVGTLERYCTYSNVVLETEEIPFNPDNHYRIRENYKPATCTSKGYTGDVKCKYCDILLEKGEERDKNPNNHNGTTKGTCNSCGARTCKCLCHRNNNNGNAWYRFCLFFWKLFRTNKQCACRRVHY